MDRVAKPTDRPKLIDRIVAGKRKELVAKQAHQPIDALRARIDGQGSAQSLIAALSKPGPHLIAEIAGASPARGPYAVQEEPGSLAKAFVAAGAAAISVVTESRFFGGGIADLVAVRETVTCPVIRRDFIVHPYQVYESRAYGADAVFLLASLLTAAQLSQLMEVSASLNMDAIVEAHTKEDLRHAQSLRPRLLCLNDWCLEDFSLRVGTALRLLPAVRQGALAIVAGNISSGEQTSALFAAGAHVILVGAAMIAAHDQHGKARELLRPPEGVS